MCSQLAGSTKDRIVDCTMGVNLEITSQLTAGRAAELAPSGPGGSRGSRGGAHFAGGASGHHSDGQAAGDSQRRKQPDKRASYKVDNTCFACKQKHSHLYYCASFIAADVTDRFDMVRQQRACGRCLSMKVK